jgi:hypothetical protein
MSAHAVSRRRDLLGNMVWQMRDGFTHSHNRCAATRSSSSRLLIDGPLSFVCPSWLRCSDASSLVRHPFATASHKDQAATLAYDTLEIEPCHLQIGAVARRDRLETLSAINRSTNPTLSLIHPALGLDLGVF